MSERINWNFGEIDNFGAELQDERAFNDQAGADTDGVYKSLGTQFDGGAFSDQTHGLNSAHLNLHDTVDGASVSALGGIDDMQNSQNNGLQQGIRYLQG